MASAANRCSVHLARHTFRTRPSFAIRRQQLGRPTAQFHRSALLRDDENDSKPAKAQRKRTKLGATSSSQSDSNRPDEIVEYGEVDADKAPTEGFLEFRAGMSRDEQSAEVAKWSDFLADPPEEKREAVEEFKRGWAKIEYDFQRDVEERGGELEIPDALMDEKLVPGLMAEGEDDLADAGEDDVFEGDDITSLAHGDLEQHREIRHYMRLAAWEMPLLSKFATKFEPPGKDRPLRFRHTSYLGESHPAESKIVVEFCTIDLPLTEAQRLKLIKLVGARYDPQQDLVRMSCEMYDTAAQNKRYLADLVATLVQEAKGESTAEGGSDKFEDTPPDFRHVRWKKRLAFPDAWKLTPDRKAAIDDARRQRLADEAHRREQNLLVDGNEAVARAIADGPVPVEAGRTRIVR